MFEKIRVKLKYLKCLITAIRKHKKINFEYGKNYAFVMLAANYNNLGDIAITIAQKKFLKDHLGDDYQIIEIPCNETYDYFFDMKKHIRDNSIITIVGGGHNGTLYEFAESQRRFIMKMFKNNIIISFPQSYFFEENKRNTAYRNEFIELCEKCKHLYMFAREKASYDMYRAFLPKNVYCALIPDMVFYLDDSTLHERNDRVTFVMRNDKEKGVSQEAQSAAENGLKKLYGSFSYADTVDIDVTSSSAETLFENYTAQIKKTGLVLTDRLHGMIISYITNTPCIVIPNNNHKIKSTFDTWLSEQNFIKMYNEDLNERFCPNIKKISIAKYFEPLSEVLNECRRI